MPFCCPVWLSPGQVESSPPLSLHLPPAAVRVPSLVVPCQPCCSGFLSAPSFQNLPMCRKCSLLPVPPTILCFTEKRDSPEGLPILSLYCHLLGTCTLSLQPFLLLPRARPSCCWIPPLLFWAFLVPLLHPHLLSWGLPIHCMFKFPSSQKSNKTKRATPADLSWLQPWVCLPLT